jgi:hypothetical protein
MINNMALQEYNDNKSEIDQMVDDYKKCGGGELSAEFETAYRSYTIKGGNLKRLTEVTDYMINQLEAGLTQGQAMAKLFNDQSSTAGRAFTHMVASAPQTFTTGMLAAIAAGSAGLTLLGEIVAFWLAGA